MLDLLMNIICLPIEPLFVSMNIMEEKVFKKEQVNMNNIPNNTVLPPVQVLTQRMLRQNMNVFYPVVAGFNNQYVQHVINMTILNLVNKLIADQGYYTNPGTQVTGWYELKTNERGVLSLNIGNYAYPPMAAHGMTYIKSLTFDTQTGRLYQLKDLFKPGSDYVKVLSDNIKVQIKERDITLLNGFTAIRPDQDYYIADKALVIYFQLYEITPYAFGFPMFPISEYELQDIIRENGPLDKMAVSN